MYIYIIGIIIITTLLVISYKSIKESFKQNKTIDCVVARYNESIDWIKMKEFNKVNRFLIYNKGKPLSNLPDNAIEIIIPNVGKCDHTFLHHIIYNYDNLADITLFVSGRADDPRKGPKIIETMRLVNNTYNSVFIGINIKIPDYYQNFTIDEWRSSNPENHIGEGNISKIAPAKIRPFGRWFNHFWPDKKIRLFVFQSIFAVSKNHIIQHPLSYYNRLYEELNYDLNPEAGHYMERAWGMVFSPFPKRCIYYQQQW